MYIQKFKAPWPTEIKNQHNKQTKKKKKQWTVPSYWFTSSLTRGRKRQIFMNWYEFLRTRVAGMDQLSNNGDLCQKQLFISVWSIILALMVELEGKWTHFIAEWAYTDVFCGIILETSLIDSTISSNFLEVLKLHIPSLKFPFLVTKII